VKLIVAEKQETRDTDGPVYPRKGFLSGERNLLRCRKMNFYRNANSQSPDMTKPVLTVLLERSETGRLTLSGPETPHRGTTTEGDTLGGGGL